jgi:hypothetical protein
MIEATILPICGSQTANALKDYLRGIHRADPAALLPLTNLSNLEWQRMALNELTSRMMHVVRILQDQELMHVSSGEVRIKELITQVIAEP